ncbi:MAG: DUF4340 domain-containing protein [candidate division Zixibacteria bacterium]|nr:DUF4340 domain-containing protein [candidate division Zixibacteria bacterium]
MTETKKTIVFVGVAVGLALLAFIFAPKRITPDAFLDQGEAFFVDFTDPNEATTLEVVEFDMTTGSPRAFKVTFENGRWTIPSHHNYPADGKERLAQTAAGVIGIVKDDFRSDNASDHEALGVIDPLDESASLTGRGKRITIKGAGGKVLADFIVGNFVEQRPGMRFVRVPDQKRVYAVRMDIDISTRFEDWIETDLLQLARGDVKTVILNDYNINERTRSVDRRDNIQLALDGDVWSARGMKNSQQVDSTVMDELLATLDELPIVGVRPKPAGLSASLRQDESAIDVSQADKRSLQGKGYYFTGDGQLMSNEGELLVHTTRGVAYTLRFGEVVHGSGLAVTAGSSDDGAASPSGAAAQNRYLFVSAQFEASAFPEPPKPSNTNFLKVADTLRTEEDRSNKALYDVHTKWERDFSRGRETTQALNDRFADWYFVISSDSFDKLHRSRGELVVKKSE